MKNEMELPKQISPSLLPPKIKSVTLQSQIAVSANYKKGNFIPCTVGASKQREEEQKEGRKKGGRKQGRKQGRKEGKEDMNQERMEVIKKEGKRERKRDG